MNVNLSLIKKTANREPKNNKKRYILSGQPHDTYFWKGHNHKYNRLDIDLLPEYADVSGSFALYLLVLQHWRSTSAIDQDSLEFRGIHFAFRCDFKAFLMQFSPFSLFYLFSVPLIFILFPQQTPSIIVFYILFTAAIIAFQGYIYIVPVHLDDSYPPFKNFLRYYPPKSGGFRRFILF